ncbi:hypothetical protein LLE49_02955 [Alicyclobacillus tolerans]|uniref:hypothetical protein n=1 Tax=Alicyclobacillus tolerans TaxID=90970 RepID=UPI001F27FB92|nr:hypothetical protein [Alicyclobacillus tolerans]MCF8563699.1 hypothetical protein [Alicyclobacillus tolerans]
MLRFGFVSEQSRKAKASRNLYEYLRQRVRTHEPPIQWEAISGYDGLKVPLQDKYRVLNVRLHDEHLSPYFKTDMNLFHMLMMDETSDMTVYKADRGWLYVFEGIPEGPKPFGQSGYDMR